MFIVTVEFEVNAEHVAEFRHAMNKQASDSLNEEPACQQFDVCFSPNNDAICFLYEQYDDRAAFDAHLQSNHFQNFDRVVAPWVIRKDVKFWKLQIPVNG